ncbi:MAG: DUF1292 domain-containing protein [Lachnospiraceae bacterium]|nr:DUF1292 domain-containing protein [Lachnospiraceae bacterium]MBQ3968793.1 DUF1292 domain-containing protein [Lachnospiraceae bacterium]MBR4588969.1 DUF1292 domain-containing protein [Lachnospiraceae bacterium]MCR4927151.1 DUF1292 domain-containing protein [Lachnospiraceae bacterium]
MEMITFTDDNGEEVNLYVFEETKVAGVNYLLVSESMDTDAEMYIFKEVFTSEDGEELSYEPVEEDSELEYIGKIFEEMMNEDET